MICAKDQHSPRLAFGEWQWCRSCGALRHPGGRWESPTGEPEAVIPATEPALRLVVQRLSEQVDRDAQVDVIRRFAKMSAGSGSDAERIDHISRDFALILRQRNTMSADPPFTEGLEVSAGRVLFTSAHVDADEAAAALAALLKAAGLPVRLWAGRKGQSLTIVVDVYDAGSKQWIPIDPMGGL